MSARFWPLGRRRNPKQLLAVRGGRTLLQETAQRLLPLVPWERMLVVTGTALAASVRRQLPEIPRAQILAEPVARDTAACLALAAEWLLEHVGEAVMLALPADHVIRNGPGLRRSLAAAARTAVRHECLVTIGVRPTKPATGYGYIEPGAPIANEVGRAHWVRRFREKPTRTTARRYLRGGRHLWNSGMFVWKASAFRAALQSCLPGTARLLHGVYDGPGAATRLRARYRRLPKVSVDRGVLQPLSGRRRALPRIAVLRASFDWVDAGSWDVFRELWGTSRDGNAVHGKVVALDASDCIVYSPGALVALVGVSDLVVVSHGGALLVCARDRVQDVRAVPGELDRRGWSEYT